MTGSRTPRLSTRARISISAALFLTLVTGGGALLDTFGFAPVGYKGRITLVREELLQDLYDSARLTRFQMDSWLAGLLANAQSLTDVLAQVPEFENLLTADRRGWDPEDRKLAELAAQRLRAYLNLSSSYRDIFVAHAGSGALVASAKRPPFWRAEDVSWVGPLASLRQTQDGLWELASPGKTSGGSPVVMVFVIDPHEFFQSLQPRHRVGNFSSSSVLLSESGIVLISQNPGIFREGTRAIPPVWLQQLASGEAQLVRDQTGTDYFAQLSSGRQWGGFAVTVVTLESAAPLSAAMRSDLGTVVSLQLGFILLGIFLTIWVTRRLFRPLAELAETVAAFARDGSPPRLGSKAPAEIELIAESFRELTEQVQGWRQRLEAEVESRTAALRLRGAIALAFADQVDDDAMCQTAMRALCGIVGAQDGCFVWFDGSGAPCAVTLASQGCIQPDPEQLGELRSCAARHVPTFSGIGIELEVCAGTIIGNAGEELGLVIVGGPRGCLDRDAPTLVEAAGEALLPLLRIRQERARQEIVRQQAERSLRRSEERLRTFFEESKDMIYTANAEDVIASMNSAGIELLRVHDRFEAVGKPFSEFVLSSGDRDLFLEKLRKNGFVRDYEIVLKRGDGSTVFCLETAQAVRDRSGLVIEVQGIIKDISERISAEQELWRTNMELAETNSKLKNTQVILIQQEKLASIGQLASGIAHEINNPLGFLKSNHGVLRDFVGKLRTAWERAAALDDVGHELISRELELDYVFSEAESLLDESDDGYRRIIDIVKNLRTFARMEPSSAFAPYDLNKGIESTLVVARNEYKYYAEIATNFGELPPIEASGGEINQVILNLVVNAAQAIGSQNRSSPGVISITTLLSEAEGRAVVRCEVADDGPGVPEELRLKVFDPFFTTKPPGKGTGLGLSISYDIIVAKHGGSFGVGNSPLGGALFRIELPVRQSRLPQ